ncbi:hypothetical protein KCU74_g129, partial [Aureobasidium melanogenum]
MFSCWSRRYPPDQPLQYGDVVHVQESGRLLTEQGKDQVSRAARRFEGSERLQTDAFPEYPASGDIGGTSRTQQPPTARHPELRERWGLSTPSSASHLILFPPLSIV